MESDLQISNQDSECLGTVILKGLAFGAAIGAGLIVAEEVARPTAKRIGFMVNTAIYDDAYGHSAMLHGIGETVASALNAVGDQLDASMKNAKDNENTDVKSKSHIEDAEILEEKHARINSDKPR